MNTAFIRFLCTACALLVSIYLLLCSPALAAISHYTYDDLDRIVRVDYANGSKIEFTYDDMGNRLSKMETAASIAGKVLDDIGNPIEGVCVHALSSRCGTTSAGSGLSEADGSYSMTLPPGEYYLSTDVTCGNPDTISYFVLEREVNNNGFTVC